MDAGKGRKLFRQSTPEFAGNAASRYDGVVLFQPVELVITQVWGFPDESIHDLAINSCLSHHKL